MTVVVASHWDLRPRDGCWTVWALDGSPPPTLPDGWDLAPVGDLANLAANRLRDWLIELDGELFAGTRVEDWAASGIAERNPYTSDLARSIATAVALVQAARTGGDVLVIVGDVGLGRALASICTRAGIAANWRGTASRRWRDLAAVLQGWASLVRGWWLDARAMRRHRLTPESLRGRDLWLMAWAGAGSFGPDGLADVDRYLGTLPRLARGAGLAPGYVGNPVGWVDGIDAIASGAAAKPAVTLAPAFFSLAGRLRAAWTAARIGRAARRTLSVEDLDISPLVRRALAQEVTAGIAPRAALFREIARDCARRNLAPRILVYPYENQPWEKQLLAGFRRHCPGTILLGFQHTVFATNYFSADPSRWQLQHNLFPDLLIASGAEYRERLIRRGVDPGRILLGGAFRFPHFAAPPETARTTPSLRTILVSLPLQADESEELSTLACTATAALDIVVLISFHPMLDAATRARIRQAVLAARADDAGGKVRFSDAPARDLLGKADLMLYHSSGAVFDAAATGVPSVYVGLRTGLDLDKLPGGNPWACRGADGLRRLLIDLMDEPARLAAHAAALRRRLEAAFAPPQDDLVAATLRRACRKAPRA